MYVSGVAFIGFRDISLKCYSYINIQQNPIYKTFLHCFNVLHELKCITLTVSIKTLFHVGKQLFMIIATIVINMLIFIKLKMVKIEINMLQT